MKRTVTFTIEETTYEKIKHEADAVNRSMSNYIEWTFEKKFQKKEKSDTK